MQLSQKETSLLKDLKGQEKLCVDKYTKHSSCAKDPQLKNLFTQISQVEQQHYETITQIENGAVPTLSGGAQGQPSFSA
ncbi:MAG: ferritin-like domain-containing protein, partial [Selenomonadaceae bacterium]